MLYEPKSTRKLYYELTWRNTKEKAKKVWVEMIAVERIGMFYFDK